MSIIQNSPITDKLPSFLRHQLLPVGLPVLLALIFGPLLAGLAVAEQYLYALALLFAVPVGVWLNRYPFSAFIVWVVVVPLIPPGEHSRYLYWVVHRSLIPLALGLNILSRMFKLKTHRPVRLGWPDLIMMAFIGLGILSVLFNDELILETRLYIFALYDRTFIPFTAYWLVRFFHPSAKELKRLAPLFAMLIVAQFGIGMVAWFVPEMLPEMWLGRQELLGQRVTGPFSNPGAYSTAIMFFVLLTFQGAMAQQQRFFKILYLGAIACGLIAIFFTFSRGSWVSALLVLLVLAVMYARTVLPFVVLGGLMLGGLLGTVLNAELDFAMDRLMASQSAGSRLILANAGQKMFLEKPIFGWGYGSYDIHDWKFMERVGEFVPREFEVKRGTSHNSYLTILAEMGFVGFFCYFFPFLWWAWWSLRAWRRIPPRNRYDYYNWRFLVILWANIGFILLVGQFTDTRRFWFTLGEMWITLGLIANYVDDHVGDVSFIPVRLRRRLLRGA